MKATIPAQESAGGLAIAVDERDAKRLLVALIAFECALLAVFVFNTLFDHGLQVVGLLFDLDGEANVPAWFSSVQLFVIGLIFMLKARQPRVASAPSPLLLATVGAAFLFLSADEAASIHENLNGILQERTDWLPRFRFGHGIWIFLYVGAAAGFLALFRRQVVAMWSHYREETTLMATGVGLFLLGGVGLEIIAYQYLGATLTPRIYPIEVAAEEFLEMVGMSFVLYGALLMLIRGPRERLVT